MAGAANPLVSPHPKGAGSLIPVRIGGYCPTGLAALPVDTFTLPWDCYVRGVDIFYASSHASADIDAVTLKTVDATALSLITALDPSADVVGVAQTLHADIVNVK